MLYEAPFLPDEGYADFLADNAEKLLGVHFSLHSELAADGRPPAAPCPPERLSRLLSRVQGLKKYALLNSRFHDPGEYFDGNRLGAVADLLDSLREAGNLDGIVYADHYLLQALSDARPQTCAGLEAVPSVNAMLDSAPKALRRLRYIETTAFLPPTKIILDRSLNRDIATLEQTSAEIRQALPETSIVLLANEGCLAECPFKQAHDSLIALSSLPCGNRSTFTANARLGCGRLFSTDPRQIFTSPFIRPEDAHHYEPHADALKLCGRTLGPTAMRRVVSAYLAGRYVGNLLHLLDTPEYLADTINIPNHTLPTDFHDTVTTCGQTCHTCPNCSALAANYVERKGATDIFR